MTKRRTVKDLHSAWLSKPGYAKAHTELEQEFQIASAVIEARMKAQLTQAQLAKRMDTTQTAVARLESGKTLPSTRTLKRVAEATGLQMTIGFKASAIAAKAVPEPRPVSRKMVKDLAASTLSQKQKLKK